MVVKIVPNEKQNPPGKLADAELHFSDGVLDGLKLIGFSVWERRSGGGRNVTFPARQYTVNGERRSFALLRPIADASAQDRIRELVLRGLRRVRRRHVDRSGFVTRRQRMPGYRPCGGTRDDNEKTLRDRETTTMLIGTSDTAGLHG